MEPTELIAAVISGWAAAWALSALTVPEIMAVLVGVCVFAAMRREYRHRWTVPAEPEPGS